MCVCVCIVILCVDSCMTSSLLGVRLNLSLDSNWGSTEWDDDKSVWMIVYLCISVSVFARKGGGGGVRVKIDQIPRKSMSCVYS